MGCSPLGKGKPVCGIAFAQGPLAGSAEGSGTMEYTSMRFIGGLGGGGGMGVGGVGEGKNPLFDLYGIGIQ